MLAMCLALAMVMIIIFPFQCPSSFFNGSLSNEMRVKKELLNTHLTHSLEE